MGPSPRYIDDGEYGTCFGVALLDVDHCKRVNDTHGHDAGDAMLRAIAERIRHAVRVEDVVGRWGGEEFLLIAPDTAKEGLAALCERIRGVVREAPVRHEDQDVRVTVRADEALYRAKTDGRDRVAIAQLLTKSP